jgi:hypothetical protein
MGEHEHKQCAHIFQNIYQNHLQNHLGQKKFKSSYTISKWLPNERCGECAKMEINAIQFI